MRRVVAVPVVLSFLGMLAGCGNTYRATVGTNNPVPIPSQPIYEPVVTSSAGTIAANGTVSLTDSQGLATILDLAGDSVLVQANVGIQPVSLAVGSGGGQGYAVNLGALTSPYQGSVSSFGVVQNLNSSQVNTTSLNSTNGGVFAAPSAYGPQSTACNLATPPPAVFANSALTYVSQTTSSTLLPLSRNISGTGVPALLTPLATTGVITNFTGLTSATHTYTIERNANNVEVIDVDPTTSMPYITPAPGISTSDFSSPVFGVTSLNGHRAFILNCNATITALDAQGNAYLSTIPIQSTTATYGSTVVSVPAGNPVWGDYYNAGSVLVTANTNGPGNGVPQATPASLPSGTPGTVSFINAIEGSSAFGSTLGTAVVGVNPSGVVVLQDGTYAYVANEGDDLVTGSINGSTIACGGCKTVSIVNMSTYTTVATIPLYYSDPTVTASCPASQGSATGAPLQIIAPPDTTDQKVYVLCDQPSGDTFYVFAIRTYPVSTIPGQTSPGNQVTAVIPIEGIPTSIKLTPAR
jgi:hypothetical protein